MHVFLVLVSRNLIILVSLTRALITGTLHIMAFHSIRIGTPSARCGGPAITKSLSLFITLIITRTKRTPPSPFVKFVCYQKNAKYSTSHKICTAQKD